MLDSLEKLLEKLFLKIITLLGLVTIWFIYLTFIFNNIDTSPIDDYLELNNFSTVESELDQIERRVKTKTFIYYSVICIKLLFSIKNLI